MNYLYSKIITRWQILKFETKLNKILAMEDSNLKLAKLIGLGLQLGIFNKDIIKKETDRLWNLGYRPKQNW